MKPENFDVSRTPRGVKVVRRHCDAASVVLLLLGLLCGGFVVWRVLIHDQNPLLLVPPAVAVKVAIRNLRTQTAHEYVLEAGDTNAGDTP